MTARARRSMTFSQRTRENWRDFKEATPGRRFQDRYRRRRNQGHSLISKVLSLVAGVVLFVIGFILLPAPGPGFLVIFLGAGMIGEESKLAARALDRAELRLYSVGRRGLRFWRSASLAVKALLVVFAAGAAASIAFVGWSVLFDR
jgi:uncharacterized protein (TIGR02611 family)